MLIYSCFGPMTRLDDGWRTQRNPLLLMRKLASVGRHPMKPGRIPNVYWELVENCWIQVPENRPAFESVVTVLTNRPEELSAAGTDLQEYSTDVSGMDSLNSKSDCQRQRQRQRSIKLL
jgi:hypothetical protein